MKFSLRWFMKPSESGIGIKYLAVIKYTPKPIKPKPRHPYNTMINCYKVILHVAYRDLPSPNNQMIDQK